MKSALFLILLLSAAGLTSCAKPKEQAAEVIVIHSGRMRGNVYPLSLGSISPLQHYQFLAGYVASVRAEAAKTGARVFLVDLGDSLSGSFASHVTGSMNMVAFFNQLDYDAVVLSNLDVNVPRAALSDLRAKVLSPFQPLAPTDEFAFPSAANFPKDGWNILLHANFYGDLEPLKHPERFPESFGGIAVRPVRGALLASVAIPSGPQLSLLSWMKFEPTDKPPSAFLQSLRDSGIDAILAHRIYGKGEREAWSSSAFLAWRPPVSLNILRNNGGFAIARMDLAREGEGWKVLSHSLVPMTSNAAAPDPQVVAAEEKYADQIAAADTPLGDLEAAVDEEGILQIYMAALSEIPGTEAVAYSIQSIRSDWPAGTLRASRLFNSLPWTTGLVQVAIKPEDITTLAPLCIIAVAPNNQPGDITITTSRFFGNLIARKLHLLPEAVLALSETSEFDFLLKRLKTSPNINLGMLSPDWTIYPQDKDSL